MWYGEEEEREYRIFQRQRRQLVNTIRREPLTKPEEAEAISGGFSPQGESSSSPEEEFNG